MERTLLRNEEHTSVISFVNIRSDSIFINSSLKKSRRKVRLTLHQALSKLNLKNTLNGNNQLCKIRVEKKAYSKQTHFPAPSVETPFARLTLSRKLYGAGRGGGGCLNKGRDVEAEERRVESKMAGDSLRMQDALRGGGQVKEPATSPSQPFLCHFLSLLSPDSKLDKTRPTTMYLQGPRGPNQNHHHLPSATVGEGENVRKGME